MIEKVFEFIISVFIQLIQSIVTLILFPVYILIVNLFPDLTTMFETLMEFIELVLPMFTFTITLLQKITLVPRTILLLYSGIFLARLVAKPVVFVYIKIKKIWAFIKGGKE